MPLSRYEIRSEYSLANPDLYRAADKDDPEGLLEGVAMAGLVGIIRQLGDLAEFAAEVFHDLHEDVLATAARSHELLVRVKQLEREVPLIEDLMFTKTDHGNFMYNPGVEWHVHIHNEQNHFTQGDLPRFIRSAYEECRSPPRLFALDRFDATGAGACLKRFTDPSFFKMDWARSELMKAEKEQRDHKARRLKKKGRRQENTEVREARIASHVKLRAPSEVENAATSSILSSSSNSGIRFEQDILDSLKQENDDMLTANSSLFSGQEGPQLKDIDVESARVEERSLEPSSSRRELSYLDTGKDVGPLNEGLESDLKEGEVMADDSASEADNFMDAVTTMDLEVETDTETKAKVKEAVDLFVIIAENEAPGSQAASESPRETGEQHVLVDENGEHGIRGEVKDAYVVADNFSSGGLMPEDLSTAEQDILVDDISAALPRAEHDILVGDASAAVCKEEDLILVNGHIVTCPPQTIKALTLDSPRGTTSSSVEEDDVAKSEGLPIDNVSRDIAEETLVESRRASSSDSNGVSTSANRSGASSPVLEEVLSSSNRESTEHVTSETLEANIMEANNTFESLGEEPSVHVSQLEESGVPEGQNQAPTVPGAGGTRKRWQINNLFDKVFLAPVLGLDGSQASESEQGESPKKPSAHSSPSSSIQPMRWAVGSSKSYHTDDEIDGLQGSSGSLSTTSSNLSSPRPSMLTTTLQSFSLGGEQESSSLPPKSADSCPPSPTCSTPKSGIPMTVHEHVSLAKSSIEVVASPASEHSGHSSPSSSSSAVQLFFDSLPSLGLNFNASAPESMAECLSLQNVGVDNFPPPPPLPPLAWRMTRRPQRAAVCFPILMDPPTPTLGQRDVGMLSNEPSQVSAPSTPAPATSHPTGVRQDDWMQSLMHETCPSEIKALHADSEEASKASKPAENERTCAPSSTPYTGVSQDESVSVSAPSTSKRENIVTALPDTSLDEKPLNHSDHASLTRILRTESTPARLDETRIQPEGKTARGYGVARQDFPANFERTEFSAEASTSYDINRLKRRSKWALTSSTASLDDREVLLQQIRTRSFSLRNASGEKRVVPRPVTNINVAAILEKANAIRQAFAGSDDDDEEWSDT